MYIYIYTYIRIYIYIYIHVYIYIYMYIHRQAKANGGPIARRRHCRKTPARPTAGPSSASFSWKCRSKGRAEPEKHRKS